MLLSQRAELCRFWGRLLAVLSLPYQRCDRVIHRGVLVTSTLRLLVG